jgi:putative SOS response-associated peptidase YedK
VAVNQKAKQPYYIRLKSAKPFAFAGLWENWQDDQGNELRSCTIITTHANELVSRIHERMPGHLSTRKLFSLASKEEKLPSELSQLLVPYPAQEMIMHPISSVCKQSATR